MTKTDKKYIEAIGRRKTSIARVRLTPASKASYIVNEKPLEEYFPVVELQEKVRDSVAVSGTKEKYSVSIKVIGGGISSQAEAIRLGISRALVKEDAELRSPLKKSGFLKRDPRSVERKKFGLRKARKSVQWSKR